MVRTQVQLQDEQAENLRQLAMKQHRSMASLVREAVNNYLVSETNGDAWERAIEALGSMEEDEATDVSSGHDDYLAEAHGANIR